MKHLDLDWAGALGSIPAWQALPVPGRRKLLDTLKPSGAVLLRELGEHLPELAASGLVAVTDTRAMVAEPARRFVRALRAADRHRTLFADPDVPGLARYLDEHFTIQQTTALVTGGDAGWGYRSTDRYEVARRISSSDWVEDFLALGSPDVAQAWERQRKRPEERAHFVAGEVLTATQRLVQGLGSLPSGVRLAELDSIMSGSAAMRGRALHAALRYVLCYLFLDPRSLEPRLGVWPAIVSRLSRPPLEPPRPLEPAESFETAFLMEDMTAVLVASAGEPLRLRANDQEIFARQQQAIATRLVAIPDWLVDALGHPPEDRISTAARQLRERKLAKVAGRGAKDLRLEPTTAGSRWLGRTDHERLTSLLDPLVRSDERHPHWGWYEHDGSRFFPAGVGFDISREHVDTRTAVADAFLSLPAGGFVGVADFLEYHSRERNPFLAQNRDPDSASSRYGWYGNRPKSREDWEDLWERILGTFFSHRLLPLGGVRLGRTGDATLCFQLGDIGRYLLGEATDFAYGQAADAEVIVQPNFEVVFLALAPQVEARLARIAERVGSGVGIVFRITRESILAAAGAGLPLEQVLESLRQSSARSLPDNVERQICDWFGTVRSVRVRRALLIHCPDAETAAKVRATGGNGLRPLTPTVLEMDESDAKARRTLQRKLRKVGVFIEM
ncbi:MAG: helicase-associated domain-containing protein [Gemmatimonadota bacterium]